MSNHTPGPWYLSDREVRQEKSCRAICEIYRGGKYEPDVITAMYNAALIAAAPDLLDMLYTVLPYMECAEQDPAYKPGVVTRITRQIREVIAKAEEVTPCQP
jgi:hypothetical protein